MNVRPDTAARAADCAYAESLQTTQRARLIHEAERLGRVNTRRALLRPQQRRTGVESNADCAARNAERPHRTSADSRQRQARNGIDAAV
jgi:hypothetical protein